MDDLTITKLCAQAMGFTIDPEYPEWVSWIANGGGSCIWDPLGDDAQAMALVKRFGLFISRLAETWYVDASDNGTTPTAEHPTDLNRCICECVARLQQAKQGAE